MKVGTELDWTSRVVLRGVEWAGPAAQAAVQLDQGGFHGRLDATRAFQSGDPDGAGLRAGYARTWGETGPTVGVEMTQSWYSRLPAGATRSTTEAGVTATWAVAGGLKPGVAWWHDFRRLGDTAEARLAAEYPLPRWGTYLEAEVFAGWTVADNVRPDAPASRLHDAYGYGGAGIRLPYRIVGTRVTVVLGAQLTETTGQHPDWSPLGRPSGALASVNLGADLDF
ncbi:MAG: hypothetical protein ACHQ4G_12785 [Opitutales bacterium]